LDEAVKEGEGAKLAMQVAILELFPDCAGGLAGAGVLEADDFDEVGDAAKIVLGDGLTCQPLNGDGDGRVGLLLWRG